MAYDLLFKNTPRNWSRADSSMGGALVIIEKPRPGLGWIGHAIGASIATRIVTGKWPWYWFGTAAKKLEG